MELVPLDVPNGGRRCEYDDINVHDVVMSEIPSTMVENTHNTSGHKQIDPLNIGPLGGPLDREN
jgi:hypothetical protein